MPSFHLGLVLLFFVGEVAALDIFDVVADGFGDYGEEVGIAAEEAGAEVVGHAEHVADDEYLAVDASAGSDSDDGDGELRGYSLCKCGGYLLEDDGEASGLFEEVSVVDELFGFFITFGAYGVGAELVDGLWHET